MPSPELLLHPVRLRIVQAFLGRRELTTGDLRDVLPEVAPATLYRQVAALVAGGVLEVVHERRARGAVERTYRLHEASASVTAERAAAMTPDEHRQGFLTFVATLLADFDRYLDTGDVDLGRDRVGYRQAAMHLSDEEMDALLADLVAVLLPRLELEPSPERTRRLFSTVQMPDAVPGLSLRCGAPGSPCRRSAAGR